MKLDSRFEILYSNFTDVSVRGWRQNSGVTQFLGFFFAFVAEGDFADFAKEAEFAEADGFAGKGLFFDGTGDS